LVFYGSNKKKITEEELMKAPIVLTSYNTLINKRSKSPLLKLQWSRVIFDEAHHLRNHKTLRFKTIKKLKSKINWLVSGTPVQNRKKDFYNLCDVIGIPSCVYKNVSDLSALTKKYVLRRTKNQIGISLPMVNKNSLVVSWKNIHEKRLSEEIHSLLPLTGVDGSKSKFLANSLGGGGVLTALLRARQSCIMPALMNECIKLFIEYGFISDEYLEALQYNSKLDAVIDLILTRKNNGKGKIIFCHFHMEIDIIAERLIAGGMENVMSYDGRKKGKENIEKIAEIANVIILQIQTGCEGLNLQKNFSEIYFVSPHWNPCVEDQAIARCHRIGQTQIVDVFKFEMRGFERIENQEMDPITLEKYINRIQNNKRNISKEILVE
jgi:SNF2 family DNA or RNA helicase